MRNNFGKGLLSPDIQSSCANANGGGGQTATGYQTPCASSSPNHFGEGLPHFDLQAGDANADEGDHQRSAHQIEGVSLAHFGEGLLVNDSLKGIANAGGDDGDHIRIDRQSNDVATSLPHSSEGHKYGATLLCSANAGSEEGKDQTARDPLVGPVDPSSLELTIATIRSRHRQRCFAMEQRKRSNLALGSFLRQQLGWSRLLPDTDRTRINKQSLALIELGGEEAKALAKQKPFETDEPAYLEWRELILASIAARTPFEVIEKQATKEMTRLAMTLPVWPWAESVKGFGAVGLATIVAETGDLSLYANPAKVWKRCGLAVMDGIRQGGLSKNAGADAWIAHGYNRERRSRIWTLGDSLLKAAGPYRDVYLERKEFRKARAEAEGLTVAPAAKIPKKRAAEFMSLMHLHRDAQRYMEKRLLKHLWQAWRQTSIGEKPRMFLSAADNSGGE